MASCFTAAPDIWEEGRSKGLLHHLSAIGGGHSHLSAQSSALGPLSRPLPSNADSSPQLPGACSPEMLWHICPGFKSPLTTPCQCSHTAVRPPCCTYVLLEKPSPQPLVSVCQVSLSQEQARRLTADSQTYCQAQHKACSSPFPSCRVMPSSSHCLGKG